LEERDGRRPLFEAEITAERTDRSTWKDATMDVAVVGGGPGGLYVSLLLKRDHPEWEITVYERNPQGVTYGWGIVLPERTLSNLEAADEPSHGDVSATATHWEPFDLYYRGERYRSQGHAFRSMLRSDLLELLQDRAREVGVELVFEEEIESPREFAAATDLVIGADGIHSTIREAYAEELGAETVEGKARFSWFGTEADFEALSHIFVENSEGIWCAHTYPGPTSTFIVDCDAETWANARLDELPETEYRAYLEDVFASHLDGHELLSQRDTWQTFTTVSNERWHHGNVALLGDAAHTAHYSIGSGTTMALEDAIRLAGAFQDADGEDHGGDSPTTDATDVESALATYESRRRPVAGSLQRAGERSRLHFEDIRRFFDLEGIQFALHHLTRSGRLTYEGLSERDPALVERFDRWFAARTPGGLNAAGTADDPGRPANRPLEVAGLTLPNRTVSAAEPTVAAADGYQVPARLAAFRERLASGAGLVLTEPLAVAKDGRITPGSPGLYEDAHAGAWAGALDEADGGTAGVHLVHAGARGAVQPPAFALDRPAARAESWAPRPSEEYPTAPDAYRPAAMDEEDIARVERSFVAAAERAEGAGFEYLQLHLGNGYLLGSFLSPVTNDRTDAYGGSVGDRMQVPLRIVRAVREVWPTERPLGVALGVSNRGGEGLSLADSFEIGAALADAGVDLIAPVGGVHAGEGTDGLHGLAGYSDQLRNELGVRTLATVQATTRDEIDTLIATGRADCCTFYGSFEAFR
jgi:anthraniloyl-CoA monooxygenase